MGSEGPSCVTIHVTGFKKFHGVAENPTETIVRNLQSFMEKRGLPKGLVLGSCTVLETAGQGALGPLYELIESAIIDREPGVPDQGQVILLHFGVNSGATRFALENQAVNEATFRCPDELGWKPQRVPILSSDGSISHTRQIWPVLVAKSVAHKLHPKNLLVIVAFDAFWHGIVGGFCKPMTSMKVAPGSEQFSVHSYPTIGCDHHNCVQSPLSAKSTVTATLPVNEITKSLRQMGYDVTPSDDAGRFVCNYVYYHSLRFAEQHVIKSLFVHVPLFSTIDEEVQMHFVASLLEVLACSN